MHFVCCCPGTTFAVFLGGGRAFWWPARSFFALKHHDNGATSMCVGLSFLSCWISLGAKKCCCPCCWRQTWGPLLKRMRLKALPWALVCTRCSKGNGLCFKRNNQNKSKTTICHGGSCWKLCTFRRATVEVRGLFMEVSSRLFFGGRSWQKT